MKVRAVRLTALLPVLAFLELEEVRMEFLFLPPMRIRAHILEGAALVITGYEVVSLP